MQKLTTKNFVLLILLVCESQTSFADSRGDELAKWLNLRGQEVWGKLPAACDEFTFARRVYLDVLGRVPSVSELRDFQEWGPDKRMELVNQLVFAEGQRAQTYRRLSADNFARHWQRVLVPPGTATSGSSDLLMKFLVETYRTGTAYDELMSKLTGIQSAEDAGHYYQLVGASPENYAGHISRVALGVRVECAQCHDHPFNDWKQSDFWGLAAFYSGLGGNGQSGTIAFEGGVYPAKLLWEKDALTSAEGQRMRLAEWMTAKENPYFAATGVNRFWQQLVGHGMYPDVENLDQASADERRFLDEFGRRFAEDGYSIQRIMAGICKSAWYQAAAVESDGDAESPSASQFARTLKVITPDQVFDSLEQSLLLSVSRIDPESPRWTGGRTQMVSRLSETIGATPEDYASGIPQALMLMNGKLTSEAINLDSSRLLRAVVESPFFNENDRIKTLYLAVLTREPTKAETVALASYLNSKPDAVRKRAYGEILWALLNSPEFVLCR